MTRFRRMPHPADTFDPEAFAEKSLQERLVEATQIHGTASAVHQQRAFDTDMRDRLDANDAHWESYVARQRRRVGYHSAMLDMLLVAQEELQRLQRITPCFSYRDIEVGETYYGREVVGLRPIGKAVSLRPAPMPSRFRGGMRGRSKGELATVRWTPVKGRHQTIHSASARHFAAWVRKQMKKRKA